MKFVSVSYDESDAFVANQRKKGVDVFWDGYTMVFFRSTPRGYSDPKGMFRRGRWGLQTRFDVASTGTWSIPVKYVAL